MGPSEPKRHKLVCADYTVAVIDTFSAMALTALKSGDTTQRVEIGKICFRFNDKNLVSGERLQGYVLKMISRWGDNMGNMPAAGVMLAGMRSEYPCQ